MMATKKQNTDFGIVLALALLVVGVIYDKHSLLVIAAAALVIAALFPVLFTPFAWVWFRMALIVENLFSKLILSAIFYLAVTPMAFLRRLFAKDRMHIRDFKKDQTSVFQVADKKYGKNDMDNQF